MKKSLVLVSTLLLLGIAGCSNGKDPAADKTKETSISSTEESTEYDAAMKKGKEAIVDKNMTKAIAAFQLALDYKKDDKEATNLMKQVKAFKAADDLKEEKKYTEALAKVTELIDQKDVSDSIKAYAEELKKEVTDAAKKDKEDKEKAAAKVAEETKKAAEKAAGESAEQTKPSTAPQTTLWNAQKRAELASFMASWGQTMGQQYIEYYPGFDVDFYGVNYPANLTNNTMNGIPTQWSDDGMASGMYNIVAVYSDIDTHQPRKIMGNHLYLFAIYNGQPSVLVTEQNQGNNESLLYFKNTGNADLSSGFAQIVGS